MQPPRSPSLANRAPLLILPYSTSTASAALSATYKYQYQHRSCLSFCHSFSLCTRCIEGEEKKRNTYAAAAASTASAIAIAAGAAVAGAGCHFFSFGKITWGFVGGGMERMVCLMDFRACVDGLMKWTGWRRREGKREEEVERLGLSFIDGNNNLNG